MPLYTKMLSLICSVSYLSQQTHSCFWCVPSWYPRDRNHKADSRIVCVCVPNKQPAQMESNTAINNSHPAADGQPLLTMAETKIALGQRLLQTLSLFRPIDGAQKIERKIGQEVKFLERVMQTGQLKVNHVLCSNLVHYESLAQTLLQCASIKHIDYPVAVAERQSPLRVDIVCDNGRTWIKVIARNPKSLSDTACGRGGYGAKTIVDQAVEFVAAAADNVYFFQAPSVRFVFAQRIDDQLADELRDAGVEVVLIDEMPSAVVVGKPMADQCGPPTTVDVRPRMAVPELNDFEAVRRVATLNLDVTTMLAYISAMTNGSADWEFPEAVLTEQALWERQSPVKAVLDSVFEDKPLICCQTAADSFWDITKLLGGHGERGRAVDLMRRVRVLPDTEADLVATGLDRLTFGGKIKTRSVRIFAFGIVHRALTVTANEGFIRSARMQGVHIPSFVHGARPLSEQKEARARRLSSMTTKAADAKAGGSEEAAPVATDDSNSSGDVVVDQ